MTEGKIRYRKGYKYQLAEAYRFKTAIRGYSVKTDWIELLPDGTMTLAAGYSWDGPSGPTKDDKTNMRASAEHDSKYQLIRLGIIPEPYRPIADREFKSVCEADGMGWIRRNVYYLCVKYFAKGAAAPGSEQQVAEAP